MLRLVVALPRSARLRVIDVAGAGYAYAALGLVGVLSCGFALGASVSLRDEGASLHDGLLTEGGRDRQQASGTLEALTSRLGELQARLTRLEVVGQRVSEATQVAGTELDFRTPLPALQEVTPASVPAVAVQVALLDRKMDYRAAQLKALDTVLDERFATAAVTPQHQPVKVPVVSSGFGKRVGPLTGRPEFHPGMDFAAPTGSPIFAAAAGLVTFSGWRTGYGNMIEIDHGDGLRTRYGHAVRNLIKKGVFVQPGQLIAQVGATGRVTGAHLHFEVLRAGRQVNPAPYLHAVRGTRSATLASR